MQTALLMSIVTRWEGPSAAEEGVVNITDNFEGSPASIAHCCGFLCNVYQQLLSDMVILCA